MAMKKTSMVEYIQQVAENKVTDYKNYNCSGCVDCCGALSIISQKEFKQLKKILKTPQWKSQMQGAKSRFIERSKREDEVVDLRCPFQNNGRCSIYAIRPQVCVEFHCSPHLCKWDLDKFMKEHPNHNIILDLFR